MRVVQLHGGRDGLWALGERLVVARDGDTLAIYDVAAEPFGREALLTSRGVADVVVAGDTLLWANQRGAVLGWRVDGTRARKWGGFALPRGPEVRLAAVSPSGLLAAAAAPGVMFVIDVSTGATLAEHPCASPAGASFSVDAAGQEQLQLGPAPAAPALTITLGDTTVQAAAAAAPAAPT